MSLADYHKPLTRRTVSKVDAGSGQFTESVSDTTFKGFIAMMKSHEVNANRIIGTNAIARLFTETPLNKTDRVIDAEGYFGEAGAVYEVVGLYNQFHKFYDLSQFNG